MINSIEFGTLENRDRFNVISKRILPVYDKSTKAFSDAETQNPAWAALDILRNKEYGAGVEDDKIDLDAFTDLAAVYDARGDRFDGVFDKKITTWEALQQVARVGRAVPIFEYGRIKLVRDELKETSVAMFTGRNIMKDTFNIEYIPRFEASKDGVEIRYFNEEKNFASLNICGLFVQPYNEREIGLFN